MMMSRLFKRKDRLAEVIIKMSTPKYYTLGQYNEREDKTIKSEMWEEIKDLKLVMDDINSKEAKYFYTQMAQEVYIENRNNNKKIKGRAIWD